MLFRSRLIALLRDSRLGQELWLLETAGGEPRLAIPAGRFTAISSPRFTPDGASVIIGGAMPAGSAMSREGYERQIEHSSTYRVRPGRRLRATCMIDPQCRQNCGSSSFGSPDLFSQAMHSVAFGKASIRSFAIGRPQRVQGQIGRAHV